MVDLGGGWGLRQGEILGIAVDAIDFAAGTLHVVQQLKLTAASPCSPRPRVASCGTCRCPVRSLMPSGTT